MVENPVLRKKWEHHPDKDVVGLKGVLPLPDPSLH